MRSANLSSSSSDAMGDDGTFSPIGIQGSTAPGVSSSAYKQ